MKPAPDDSRGGGCALGLRFVGDPIPGLIDGGDEVLPSVAVRRASRSGQEEAWLDEAEPRLLLARNYPDGRPFLRVEHDAGQGYRVWAAGHGAHVVSNDGRACEVALTAGDPIRALRLLVSQTLPLLSVLRGREVMHASAVVVGGRLIGMVALSGTGKSSTACRLIAAGGRFFADDVLALELVNGQVRAHPGPQLLNVPPAEFESLGPSGRARLGESLGSTDKVHIRPIGVQRSQSLAGMVFLRRSPGGSTAALQPLRHAPTRLLGSAFLPYLDPPERLRRQLDMAGAVEASVALASIDVGAAQDAGAVAGLVADWAGGL